MAKTIYERLRNPLDDENTIREIIAGYVDKYNMYNGLTRRHIDGKQKGLCDVKDRNDLYVFIFREWKYILGELVKRGVIKEQYKKDAALLVHYLEDKNPTTFKEVNQIMDYEEIKEEDLARAMRHFRWNKIGEFSGWEHIHSNYVRYGTCKNQAIEHRLYINCDSTVTHKLARRFMQKCNENRLSYYFKFDGYGGRDDTLVIYCDTKHLEPYVRILREIEQEENLRSSLHEPPITTSKILGWIGYGSEPFEENKSFNEIRASHLEQCINEESYEWMMRNLNSRFRLNGEEITYREYLVRGIVKAILEYYEKYTRDTESEKKYKGYTKKDIETREFKENVRRYVIRYFSTIMNFYKTGVISEAIEVPVSDGKAKISKDILENARRKQVDFMQKNSKRFSTDLKVRIKRTSEKFGIDPDNYACDLYLVEKLGKVRESKVSNMNPTASVSPSATYKVGNNPRRGVIYQGMTDEEIKAAQKKIGQ